MAKDMQKIMDRLENRVDSVDIFVRVRGLVSTVDSGAVEFVIVGFGVPGVEAVGDSKSMISVRDDESVSYVNLQFPSVPSEISLDRLEDVVEDIVRSSEFSGGKVRVEERVVEERANGRLVASFSDRDPGDLSFDDVLPEVRDICQEYLSEVERVLSEG